MEKRLKLGWIGLQIKFGDFLDGFIYCHAAFRAWRFLMRLPSSLRPVFINYERKIFFDWYLTPCDWFKDGE